MKQIISIKDLEEMSRNGGIHLPSDAILTPSARDYMRELENGNEPARPSRNGGSEASSKSAKPVT